MDKLEIQITYEGQVIKFEDGLKAYIFNLGIRLGMFADLGLDGLLRFVDKVYEVAGIPNSTWVEDVANHIANYWEKLCDLDAEDVFDDFIENKEDF